MCLKVGLAITLHQGQSIQSPKALAPMPIAAANKSFLNQNFPAQIRAHWR